MGITAVPSANLSTAGKGPASQLTADGGGSDFAALLTQQLSDPQLLEMGQQSIIGSLLGQDRKDAVAGLTEEDGSAEQDPSALLGLAALLPGLAETPKTAQPAVDATQSRNEPGRDKDQLAGIVGQLNNRAANDEQRSAAAKLTSRDDPTAALATEAAGKETAIIAVESDAGAGGGQNFAATLATHSAQAHRTQPGGESTAATVRTPIADSRWSQDFGEKVVWLAKNDQQVAQLNINPPQLGPMQITLNLSGDQATALFVSPHAEVRQAIQDAMPQLREMLAGAGINLGQANVGTQLPQQNDGSQPQFSASSRSEDDNAILRADDGQGAAAPLMTVRSGRGMVDLFA